MPIGNFRTYIPKGDNMTTQDINPLFLNINKLIYLICVYYAAMKSVLDKKAIKKNYMQT